MLRKSFTAFFFFFSLSSCASFYNQDTGYVNAIIESSIASPEQLQDLKPKDSDVEDCELEQRTYLFVSSLPVFKNWIELNKLWMQPVYEKSKSMKQQFENPISPCVKDPFIRSPANENR